MSFILSLNNVTYEVVENFDATKDYGIPIKNTIAKCLGAMEKNQRIIPSQFTQENSNKFGRGHAKISSNKILTYQSLNIGKKIGMLRILSQNQLSFDDFCELETIRYFKDQLRNHRYKNINPKGGPNGMSATQKTYLYLLYGFNNWLAGKEFEFSIMTQTGLDTYKKSRQKVRLDNVEHLLKLYQESSNNESEYIKVIKSYLLDPMHHEKKPRTMALFHNAIMAYFAKNDSPIQFKFDSSSRYGSNSEYEQKTLTLEDLFKMLTVGRPTITQKAVILCKFHRGLDNITLCDRFNFQALEQIIRYFGTDKHMKWDLDKCPVPIKLTRIKTDYSHTGFLDRDAIISIQEYLEYRMKKTGKQIQEGDPLFLNIKNEPIRETWVRLTFSRLANTSGIQKQLEEYAFVRYEKESHELRDLLKSTLLACGTRFDVADHVIGHKPKDSYEKQANLYPENLRAEYMKAAKKLNIFSNVSHYMKGDEMTEVLQRQIEDLRTTIDYKNKELEKEQQTRNAMYRWFERYRLAHPEEF